MLLVPNKLAPEKHNNHILFDENFFSILSWIEYSSEISRNCNTTMLIDLGYNPVKKLKHNLCVNIDQSFSHSVQLL